MGGISHTGSVHVTDWYWSRVSRLCLGIRSAYEREVARITGSWDASAYNAVAIHTPEKKKRRAYEMKPLQTGEHLGGEDSCGSFLFACCAARAA